MTTILLVDDSAADTAMMRGLLQRDGYHVQTAVHGCQALDQLQQHSPAAIVTDLQMPEMDGEELVRRVVDQFPGIPIILATAHGSESLAADALASGAVNFVPKAAVATMLSGVLRRTLKIAMADRAYRDFPGQLREPEFYFKLENRIAAIEPTASFVASALAAAGVMQPTTRMRIAMALASAIFSAICYGNLELSDEDPRMEPLLLGDASSDESMVRQFGDSEAGQRSVRVKISVGQHDSRVSVSHEGDGRLVRMTPAPGTPASFELEQCRGWLLITSFMDDVRLNTDCSEVVMVKRHQTCGHTTTFI